MKTSVQITQPHGCNLKSVLRKLSLLMVSALLLGPVLGRAAVYTYTSTVGGSVTTDGSGFWRTTAGTNYWRLNNAGAAGPWVNNNDAIIGNGGTPGTITLQSTPVVNNITFNSVASGNYIITASSLRIGSAANQVVTFTLGSGVTADLGNNGGSTTYLQQGGGNNGIIFSGGGTMLLTYNGTATPFTGSMTVSNGTAVFVGSGYLVAANTNNLTSGTLGSFNSTARAFTKPTTLRGNFTLGAPSPRNGNLAFDTGAWMLFGGSHTLTVDTITVTNNSVIGQDGTARGLAVSSANGGKLILNATETYTGDTTVNSGTLVLGASGALNAASGVNIAIGAKFDVSSQATWTLGSSATLKGSGTATNAASASTISGGTTVAAGTRPIVLNFTPTGFSGDTTHPSLFLETGTLSLSGNAFTVTNASGTALGGGTYRLIEQAAGSVSSSGSHSVVVAGSGITGGSTASISVSGGFVNLVVSSAAAATQIQPETAADGTGSLVSAQTVNSGNSITVYAIARAADNAFVSNSTAVWSLQNVTGGVVSGDLVPSGDTKSAVFTGNASGTAKIRATSGILTATDSGTITVTCGTATTTNPSDQIALTGATATFIVSAGSSSSPTYQWQTNGVNIGAANSASYTTPAVTVAMNLLQYRCIVSVACDSSSATSTAATLYVADPSNTSFRSTANGPWSSTSTWQISVNNGSSWIAAIAAPSDANSTNILVQSGHTVTSSGTASADDLSVVGNLTVSGGIFTVANGAAAVDANVTGTLEQTGGTLTPTGALKIDNNGTFKWNSATAPGIPTATWADGSECLVANAPASGNFSCTGISGQNFFKFTWTAANAGRAFFNISGISTRVRTNMNITLTGAGTAALNMGTNTGTLQIDGSFNITTGTGKVLFNDTAGTNTLNLYGNLNCQGNIDANASPASANINIKGTGSRMLVMTGTQSNGGRTAIGMDTGAYLVLSNTFSATLGGQTIDGTWEQNNNGGVFPAGTWGPNSAAINKGATSTAPSGLGQTFNNFTWDSASQSANIGLGGPAFTNNGTFWLKSTAGREVRFSTTQSQTVSISNLLVDASSLILSSSTGSPIVNATNVTISSAGTLKLSTSTGSPVLNVFGTFANAGTLGGNGSISGVVNNTGTISPGASIGSIVLSNAPVLSGTVLMEINTNNTPNADLLTLTSGTLTYGGTLTVTNLGSQATNGTIFTLFSASAYGGSFTTVNLPPGGAAHWKTSSLIVDGTIQFTNTTPSASDFSMGVAVGGSDTATVVGKFATDGDSDVLTITTVSTPANGTATISGGNIIYTNTISAASDSFTYTVSDGFGGTDTKTVSVTISSPEGFNKLSGPTGSGPYSFSYLGIPGQNYALDESPNLVAPYTWFPVLTNTASGTGAIDYIGVPLSYPSGSFRTRHAP